MDLRREELGQRRAHRLLPRRAAREIHVRIDREAHAGQHVAQVLDLLARKSDCERRAASTPRCRPHRRRSHRDRGCAGSIRGASRATGSSTGSRRPSPESRSGSSSGSRPSRGSARASPCRSLSMTVERMVDVIRARRSRAASPRILRGSTARSSRARDRVTARSPCRRCAISMPARAHARVLGAVLVEDRIGVVDVDQHLARRRRHRDEQLRACRRSPSSGRWPMSRARFFETPSAISSSSLQQVPSTSTQSARSQRVRTRRLRSRRARAHRTACGRCARSVISSPMLSPGTGRSRRGEYGGALLVSG